MNYLTFSFNYKAVTPRAYSGFLQRWNRLFITAHKLSCGKVVFLHMSVILFTRGNVYPACIGLGGVSGGVYTPPLGRHPLADTPLVTSSSLRHTHTPRQTPHPWTPTPGRPPPHGHCGAGKHPTGVLSCFLFIWCHMISLFMNKVKRKHSRPLAYLIPQPLHADPLYVDPPRKNIGPGSQTGSNIIQRPCGADRDLPVDRQTSVNILPCLILCRRAVKIRLLNSNPVNLMGDSHILSCVIQHLLETRSTYISVSKFNRIVFLYTAKIKMSKDYTVCILNLICECSELHCLILLWFKRCHTCTGFGLNKIRNATLDIL